MFEEAPKRPKKLFKIHFERWYDIKVSGFYVFDICTIVFKNLVEYPHLSEGLNGVSTANDKNNGHLRLTIHFLPM